MTNFKTYRKHIWHSFAFVMLSMFFFQCQTYYTRNFDYNQKLQQHNFLDADKSLDKFKLLHKKRNTLLLVLEKGKIAHLQKKYDISNIFFNQADLLIEDYKKVEKDYILASTINAQLTTYKAEEFEKIFVHYYKSLNYIYLNDLEDALVEAKRMNLALQELNDKYKNDKKRYTQDALAHILMGFIYEASGDLNNAFIAYRNAVEIYENAGGSYMNVTMPTQLKKDLIRSAYLNGYYGLQQEYEEKFDVILDKNYTPNKELILFWENGLSPVKEEWSINFTALPGSDGIVTFANRDLNLSFDLSVNNSKPVKASDLKLIRVAFPKYRDRISLYTKLSVRVGEETYSPELVEDLTIIARRTLKDRFAKEISSALIRLFLKQVSEISLRKENEDLGALLSVVNGVTEQADTRQWQSLPGQISYIRVPVEEDQNTIELSLSSSQGQAKQLDLVLPKNNNRLIFSNVHTLESITR